MGFEAEGFSSSQGPGAELPSMTLSRVPAQVEVAFDILKWANAIESGRYDRSYESDEGRSLTLNERAVYEAAMEVVRLYLTGEMTFANFPEKPDESEDSEPVSVDVEAAS